MTVRFLPSQREIVPTPHETLLESALRAGLTVGYGCNNGSCGACKARLVSGTLTKVRHTDHVLSEAEKQQGIFLLCSHRADGEVTMEVTEAHSASDIPHQEIPCKVRALEPLTPDALLLHLRTPRSKTLRFIAGQHVQLKLDRDISVTRPVASCPCDAMNLQFHVCRADDATFFEYARNLSATDSLTIAGPSGNFLLDEQSARPITFIAYGSGFAPIRSLIEHAMSLELAQPMRLFWITPNDDDRYLHNYCRALTDALDNFRYLPVTLDALPSAPTAIDAALARILADSLDMSPFDVYIAAPHNIARAARDRFVRHGLPPQRFFSEEIDRLK